MGKILNIVAIFGVIAAMMGAMTMGSVFAATNTTTMGYNSTGFNAEGHPVFYIVMHDDGSIHPATMAERAAIDVAIADGSIERADHERYMDRDV